MRQPYSRNVGTRPLVSLVLIFSLASILCGSNVVLSGSPHGLTHAANPSFQTRAHPEPSTQTIYAPIVRGLKKYAAEIVLNNNSPKEMEVKTTFFRMAGTPLRGNSLTLRPAEVRHVNVTELAEMELKEISGMTVSYFGGMLEVGAQMVFVHRASRRSIDIPFSAPMDYRSNIQEAVWWMPSGGEATVILGNASDSWIQTRVEYSNGEVEDVLLEPLASRELVRSGLASRGFPRTKGYADSARITLTGPIGSLRATGFVRSSGNFSSGIRFYDPANIAHSDLFATNVRLRKSKPRLVLKNVGDDVVSARARFISDTGRQGPFIDLPDVIVPPHSTVELDLKPVRKAAETLGDLASVHVASLSGNNSLIGALYSSDSRETQDVPLRDIGPARNSTGSYPWRVDGDYSTIVSITNALDEAATFIASVNYPGGRYLLETQQISGRETRTFDIRELRDDGKPDRFGNVIPGTQNKGQFRWSVVGGGGLSRLIGRAETKSASVGVMASYSCPVCCPDSFVELVVSPTTSSGIAGGTAILQIDGLYIDCYFNLTGPFGISASQTSWTIGDTNIISVSPNSGYTATMYCLSPGSSTWEASTVQTWWDNDGMDCYPFNQPFTDSGSGFVRPEVELLSSLAFNPASFTNPPDSQSTLSFEISASPADPEGLQTGDFARVEIIEQTSGGNFTYTPSSQIRDVTLNLGTTASSSFLVQFNSGEKKAYTFGVRISDVRRPDGMGGSSSIMSSAQVVVKPPPDGKRTTVLTVNAP